MECDVNRTGSKEKRRAAYQYRKNRLPKLSNLEIIDPKLNTGGETIDGAENNRKPETFSGKAERQLSQLYLTNSSETICYGHARGRRSKVSRYTNFDGSCSKENKERNEADIYDPESGFKVCQIPILTTYVSATQLYLSCNAGWVIISGTCHHLKGRHLPLKTDDTRQMQWFFC